MNRLPWDPEDRFVHHNSNFDPFTNVLEYLSYMDEYPAYAPFGPTGDVSYSGSYKDVALYLILVNTVEDVVCSYSKV